MVKKYEEEVLKAIEDNEYSNEVKKVSKYEDPDVINYIVTCRTHGKNITEITEGLKERGYPNIAPQTVSELFKMAVAKTTLVHNTANEKFQDFSNQLDEMYSKAIKVLNNLINVLDKIYEEYEASDMETMQKYLMFIKLTPQIKLTTDQIFRLINDYKEQQDKIIQTRELNAYSIEDMMKYDSEKLRLLEKNGDIKIINKNLIK